MVPPVTLLMAPVNARRNLRARDAKHNALRVLRDPTVPSDATVRMEVSVKWMARAYVQMDGKCVQYNVFCSIVSLHLECSTRTYTSFVKWACFRNEINRYLDANRSASRHMDNTLCIP